MKDDKLSLKREIINTLVNSGINATPEMLDFILNLENPQENLNLIIKETSFIPNFKSHLTGTVLKEISNEKLQSILKRVSFKPKTSLSEKYDSPVKSFSENLIKGSQQELKSELSNLAYEVENQQSAINKSVKFDNILEEKESNLIKRKLEIKPIGSAKSNLKFKPIAKDYASIYEILKDPTGKLYTSGDYEDFYEYTKQKFTKLHNLMRKRPDVLTATNINNILRLSSNSEVSTIGLVSNIHQTKNNNFLFELEDTTGVINVLIRKSTEEDETIKKVERIVNDQMLYVEGVYNAGDKGKKGIIFANYLTKIDIPADFQPSLSNEPLSIALISDTHIGSKEFEEPLFKRFIDFINGKIGNKSIRDIAGKIKYIVINGDLVDGIGVYPNQEIDLVISDIYNQYKKAAELLYEIPDYIQIFYISGNHEPVRNAIARPAVPKKYCEELLNLGVKCLGNPSMIKTNNVKTLVYHGESMHDMNMLLYDLDINKPAEIMKELLICRHLAPIYGEKTQIAPTANDWLVIDHIPDIFHTGHIHINGLGYHRNVTLINSGCFQAQTDFMRSFGIKPTPGIVPIIELNTLKPYELDLKSNV
ncbi:MAG: metallophosphoesterase [Promethearchaeota archaeon]